MLTSVRPQYAPWPYLYIFTIIQPFYLISSGYATRGPSYHSRFRPVFMVHVFTHTRVSKLGRSKNPYTCHENMI